MNWNEICEKIEQNNVKIYQANLDGICGLWDPIERHILIDTEFVGHTQTLAHEYVHSIDPACDGTCDNELEYARAELRAEYGASLLVDEYDDDGYLNEYSSGLDVNDILDQYENAEKLLNIM